MKEDKIDERYKDHPKNERIIQLKKNYLDLRNHAPMLLKTPLKNYDLTQLGEFDVIHVDPPWKEYQKRAEYF